ncbi:P-loop containing nucleoside triphosphate hydrolase protein [Dunaliella salina]|uniref:P-loop containing nucleoside triphosphate hydrolase protein n=1 Tax=Dunaliella salina TaxID=3046 RepID=A0ABQ7GAA0_DUNSA|nr:P-loop containing nucleoside triphosphate hydrolase protein [Dunaliella salina]|eukprot:KAF5831532.1 P-loop containing nucleoside triphosphate hydrolase protein [Dunaliella salina]
MESAATHHHKARGILSVAVLGSRCAGKSTLLGHLLVKIGGIEPQGMAHRLARAEQDANDAGQRDAAYAWVVYKRKAERSLSMTLDLNVQCCTTCKHKITFTDTPGTREAVRFVARGVAGQDAAVVVVDASCADPLGERAVADTDQGLLYEHVLIAYGMGIRQLVVAINKMDAVNFSQERFEEVQAEVLKVLKKANYNEEQRRKVVFVPVAGLPGDNLDELSGRMPWFERTQGATLLEAIEAFRPLARPTQPLHQPEQQQQQQQNGKEAVAKGGYAGLVMPVQCVIKVSGIGTVCLGRIEAGSAKAGMQVGFVPCMSRHKGLILACPVKSLESHCESFVCASSSSHSSSTAGAGPHSCSFGSSGHDGVLGPGHSVGMALRGITQRQLRKGWVAVDAEHPPKLVSAGDPW